MSVYTAVDRQELTEWLAPLGVGRFHELVGIAAGMQNSNYFVTTESGRYVLTVFESIASDSLDFYLALQAHLARQGIPAPRPLPDRSGRYWRDLAGKPAALLTCLPGAAVEAPGVEQCHAIGVLLARLHQATLGFPAGHPNPCGADWRHRVGTELLPLVHEDERALLAEELAFDHVQDWTALPQGIVHADLFRDNVLWQEDGSLGGVLDFYFAGQDALLYDLAVVANDWCASAAHLTALLAGYEKERPLDGAEQAAWPAMRRAAALRFWLLRLQVRHQPRSGSVVTIKNPDDFKTLLTRLRLAPDALPR